MRRRQNGMGMNPRTFDWRQEGTSEWYESVREEYWPNYGEGHLAYGPSMQNNYGFDSHPDAYSRELDASYGDNMQGMGSLWTDFRDSLKSEAGQTLDNLIQHGGDTIQTLITGEQIQAPPGQVAVGFDPSGQPIFVPAREGFMDKYGVIVYGGLAAVGILLLGLLLRRPSPAQRANPKLRKRLIEMEGEKYYAVSHPDDLDILMKVEEQ